MTLKHEAGHAALGHTGAEDKADEEEAEAAFFAKYASAPPLVHRIRPKFASDLMISFGLSYEAAKYAFAYYQKWLQFSSQEYLPYERELLKLFSATGWCQVKFAKRRIRYNGGTYEPVRMTGV